MILDASDGNPQNEGGYSKIAGGHQGAVYAVAGSSSFLDTGPFNHPAIQNHQVEFGSTVVDVDGDQMDVKFLDFNGVERDSFTIIKTGLTPPTATSTSSPTHANINGDIHAHLDTHSDGDIHVDADSDSHAYLDTDGDGDTNLDFIHDANSDGYPRSTA